MPYADAGQQREAVRKWRAAHPEKVAAYRKTSMLRKSMNEQKLPRASSIRKHALTEREVRRLVEGVLGLRIAGEAAVARSAP